MSPTQNQFLFDLATTGIGAFLGVLGAWILELVFDRKETRRRDRDSRVILIDGLHKNLLVIRQMQNVLAKSQTPPSIRLNTRHFSIAHLQDIPAYQENPDQYSSLMGLADATEHMNRRLDSASTLQLLNMNLVAAQRLQFDLEPYVKESRANAEWIEATLGEALTFLEASERIAEARKAIPSPYPRK